jgi:hypothetical protein
MLTGCDHDIEVRNKAVDGPITRVMDADVNDYWNALNNVSDGVPARVTSVRLLLAK